MVFKHNYESFRKYNIDYRRHIGHWFISCQASEYMNNQVIICGRREEKLAEVKRQNDGIINKVCDVSDTQQLVDLTEWVPQNYPDINILINNAGVQLHCDLTMPGSFADVRKEMEINFIAPVHLTQMLAARIALKDNAAIINITSRLAFVPLAVAAIYSASKAALHSFTLSLRHQLKDMNVKVFEIAPPMVDTELGHHHREDKTQSHGGMETDEFVNLAIDALKNDQYEAAIGFADGLRAKPDEMFFVLNK